MATTGVVTQVIGSTFDAQFPEDSLPDIYSALQITTETKAGPFNLVGEVQQHLGGGRVRAVALGSTDGLTRGAPCNDTGGPVTVPVGEQVLGLPGEPRADKEFPWIDAPRGGTAGPPLDRLAPAIGRSSLGQGKQAERRLSPTNVTLLRRLGLSLKAGSSGRRGAAASCCISSEEHRIAVSSPTSFATRK